MNDKLKQIADFYGLEIQFGKLAEECAEFCASVFKHDYYTELRLGLSSNYPVNRDLIAKKGLEAHEKSMEELADVLLMARQIEYLLEGQPDLKEKINKHIEAKTKRQLKRMKEEKAQ